MIPYTCGSSIDTREVALMWWEIDPIWKYHSGGDYILNLWKFAQASTDTKIEGVEEATTR
jgi:hypothetical protein